MSLSKQRKKFWARYIAQVRLVDGTWKERKRNNNIERLFSDMQQTKWHNDGREWRIFRATDGKVISHLNRS